MPEATWSVTDLLELAARARFQARRFAHHPAATGLLNLADELNARAEAAMRRTEASCRVTDTRPFAPWPEPGGRSTTGLVARA